MDGSSIWPQGWNQTERFAVAFAGLQTIGVHLLVGSQSRWLKGIAGLALLASAGVFAALCSTWFTAGINRPTAAMAFTLLGLAGLWLLSAGKSLPEWLLGQGLAVVSASALLFLMGRKTAAGLMLAAVGVSIFLTAKTARQEDANTADAAGDRTALFLSAASTMILASILLMAVLNSAHSTVATTNTPSENSAARKTNSASSLGPKDVQKESQAMSRVRDLATRPTTPILLVIALVFSWSTVRRWLISNPRR